MAWGRCTQGWWWARETPAPSSTRLPGRWHTWTSFLPTPQGAGTGCWACAAPVELGHTCSPHLQSVAGKLPWGPTTDMAKVSSEKKEISKVMALNLCFTCRFPPDLNYFFFFFINNTVGVWGAHCLSCIQFNGRYLLAAERKVF